MLRSANRPEEEKTEVVKQAEVHLLAATKAQSYLKAQVARAKENLKTNFLAKGLPIPPIHSCLPACSNAIAVHYSFDFAQQVP